MELTSEMIEAFAGVYLSPKYDDAKPTPQFHRECWEIYCGEAPAAATAAPRGHAKSTALTHDFGLAMALFRQQSYIIVLSSTEKMAIEHLGDIANELRDNEDIIRDFKIKGFLVDQKTDIIVECVDGYQFRFTAHGAEQKIRGSKWQGKRPGLILCDDLEDDEQVESRDRRVSFRRWFFRACKPALRSGGQIRVHGTILHEDSLLNHLIKNPQWDSRLFKAHRSFDDFSDILWPEMWSEEDLRAKQQEFIKEQDAAGYSQEFLNDPFDNEDAYLKADDFIAMKEDEYEYPMLKCVGCDFAVSKEDKANRTSFTVAGKAIDNNLYYIDQRVDRWDTGQWIDVMFDLQEKHNPDMFFVEGGVIWKAVEPMIKREMRERDIWLSITVINPVKDKKVRARAFQKRMRAGSCKFDKTAVWYDNFEAELLRFTGDSEALLDDQLDSAAIVARGFEDYAEAEEEDFDSEENLEFLNASRAAKATNMGRSPVTGY